MSDFILAYPDFPFMRRASDKAGNDLILRGSDQFGRDFFTDDPIDDFGGYFKVLINSSFISEIRNGLTFDYDMTQYPYCKITMENGAVYYLDYFFGDRWDYDERFKEE